MNNVVLFIISFVIGMIICLQALSCGLPHGVIGIKTSNHKVIKVIKESPASKSGLKIGDQIIKIDGDNLGARAYVPLKIRRFPGESVSLTIKRNNKILTYKIKTVDESELKCQSVQK